MSAQEAGPRAPAWIELVPRGQVERPSFWWCAMRFMHGAEKLHLLEQLLRDVVAGWEASPSVRIRRDATDPREMELVGPLSIKPEHKREASLLTSELLFHVRVALDHVVYQAAWQHSGRRQRGTAFPLCLEASEWPRRAGKDLRGVSVAHRALVERVQPFHGTSWTHALSRLSNRDKHRTAVEVTPTYRCKVDLRRRYADPLGDPDYAGLQVEDPELRCRLIAADDEDGGEHVEARDALADIVRGAAELHNHFLVEGGLSPIDVQVGVAPPADLAPWSRPRDRRGPTGTAP